MDDFAMKPGVPNMYGLVGASANAIAPGKRPFSSMAPTFVEGERGIAILGSPGGSFIPTMVLLGILSWSSGADAATIVGAPRFHHQYRPDNVLAEASALSVDEQADLERRGHALRAWPPSTGTMQAVTWDRATLYVRCGYGDRSTRHCHLGQKHDRYPVRSWMGIRTQDGANRPRRRHRLYRWIGGSPWGCDGWLLKDERHPGSG